MITAAQAKALYDESGAETDRTLAQIESKIIEAAKNGKREYIVYETDLWSAEPSYRAITPTAQQARLCLALQKLDYAAKVVKHGHEYIPRSAEDDVNAQMHVNHVIKINW